MPSFPPDPADPAELQRLIGAAGITPNKLRGQNFLIDPTIADALVEAAPLVPGDLVLEIGPGFGVITQRLLARGAHVVAVEADAAMVSFLQQQLHHPELQIIQDDILRLPLAERFTDFQYHLVSSLPYSITSRVFRIFLEQPPRPKTITVLIQQEVAERLVAKPGDLSQLGILGQLYSSPYLIFGNIPPGVFHPAPGVHSAILHCTDIEEHAAVRASWGVTEQHVWKFVRAGFQNRRKMLKNNLANLPGVTQENVKKWLEKHDYSPFARAQDIQPDHWPIMVQQFFDES